MFSAFYYLQYCILSMYIILSIYVYFQYVYICMYSMCITPQVLVYCLNLNIIYLIYSTVQAVQ